MSIGAGAKIVRQFSRNIENLFFILLYREIILKVFEEFEDPHPILRSFGANAAETSCAQHKTVLKLIKLNPGNVVDTVALVWYIVFGQEIEFEHEIVENKEENVRSVIIKTNKCPLCSGLNQNEYFGMIPLEKLKAKQDGYACVLCAMIEGATNYILGIHGQPYELKAKEIDCRQYGKDFFVLKIDLYKTK